MPEIQENQQCSSYLKVYMLMTQEEVIFQVKSKDRKKPMSQCPNKAIPYLMGEGWGFLFLLNLSWLGELPSAIRRMIWFTQSTSFNVNLTPKCHHRNTKNKCLTTCVGPLQLRHKINHCRFQVFHHLSYSYSLFSLDLLAFSDEERCHIVSCPIEKPTWQEIAKDQ